MKTVDAWVWIKFIMVENHNYYDVHWFSVRYYYTYLLFYLFYREMILEKKEVFHQFYREMWIIDLLFFMVFILWIQTSFHMLNSRTLNIITRDSCCENGS